MSALLPERLGLLGRAAELRAAGTPWPDVATKLATGPDDLRRLATEHARAFGRLARRAKREFRREVMAAAVARLRELLKSQQEGVALAAAATLVRYELAQMRDRRQSRADRKARHKGRRRGSRRDELPTRPGLTLTPHAVKTVSETVQCDTAEAARCDTTAPAPQVLTPQGVPTAAPSAEKVRCDTGCDSVLAAPADMPRGSTKRVDAIRRGRWLPPGLAPPH